MAQNKIVVCGAGFIGKQIARNLLSSPANRDTKRIVQLSSRNPTPLLQAVEKSVPKTSLYQLRAVPLDITNPSTLAPAFEGAHTVISLVGILHGKPSDFEKVQWRGAENVAATARQAGARLIHISAIGANPNSDIAYWRTKGLGESAVLAAHPEATIIRPSLVFGPEDDFFNRFAKLARLLPVLPVFGGGNARFQPVYVGDLAEAVEAMCRGDREIERAISGKIMEAGGPRVFTYYELMETVLKYAHRYRPIISIPFWMGVLSGMFSERLPVNLFTITKDQVKQLQYDNIVNPDLGPNGLSFDEFVQSHCSHPLTPLYKVVPSYLD
ncbi:hypothetical protein EST38_g6684 [Candolleomyces aberdarensis]|uniref:NAD-dependent epimerase/dehydratase domain-containing protein n=1 Tax=Candolleomyces aberdarensis TaxID=2316362 RepID=A0A4Q2DJ86_9AGAR|nr:hypothetical protein EST38_g6684 [Candolleomyces aberdarensis]